MNDVISILDLKFKPYISEDKISAMVKELARKIDEDYRDKESVPLFLCILNGSFMFCSDLLKQLKTPSQIEFVRLKSYMGTQSTENVQMLIDLNINVKNRDVILIEDIVDTGHTLSYFIEILRDMNPRSIKIASLIFKKEAFRKNFSIDYLGFEIENKFIVGYGLDYNELGRNLPAIFQLVD